MVVSSANVPNRVNVWIAVMGVQHEQEGAKHTTLVGEHLSGEGATTNLNLVKVCEVEGRGDVILCESVGPGWL